MGHPDSTLETGPAPQENTEGTVRDIRKEGDREEKRTHLIVPIGQMLIRYFSCHIKDHDTAM